MREFPSSLATTAKSLGLGFALACALSTTNAQAFGGLFDGGGRVGDYLDYVGAANATGARVEIGGVCASACTMKLGARNACVSSSAQLWFHAARNPDGRVNALATLMMLQNPAGIRAWARARGALESTALTTMSGAEAISLGVRSCDRPAVQQANYLRRAPRRPSPPMLATVGRADLRRASGTSALAPSRCRRRPRPPSKRRSRRGRRPSSARRRISQFAAAAGVTPPTGRASVSLGRSLRTSRSHYCLLRTAGADLGATRSSRAGGSSSSPAWRKRQRVRCVDDPQDP